MDTRRKLLLVDDNPTNLEILQDIFLDTYLLESAGSGMEAIEKTEAFQPDLILLDLMMPGMDGYETCRKIRKLSMEKEVTIILISAKTLSSEMEEGYRAGADDYLLKPFDIENLMMKCEEYLA